MDVDGYLEDQSSSGWYLQDFSTLSFRWFCTLIEESTRHGISQNWLLVFLKLGEMARLLIFLLVAHLLIFLPNPAAILAAESTNESVIDRRALLSFMQAASDPLGALSSWGGNASLHCR